MTKKTQPTPKAPQNQPTMTPEEKDRVEAIRVVVHTLMDAMEGMLVNDAIAALKTCESIIQSKLQEVYNEQRVERKKTDD